MSMRIGTAQPAQRLIDFNIRDSAKGLAAGESNGGTIVAAGPPERVAAASAGYTGPYLGALLHE